MQTTITSLVDYDDPDERTRILSATEEIFRETAVVTVFETPEKRSEFQWRYFGYYATHAPELFLLAIDTSRVLGYICGVADTRANGELYLAAPHIPVFDDLFDRFPAHFHINLAATSRGQGLGGRLVNAFEQTVAAKGVPGIHLVTAPEARNVGFYQRNGYSVAIERPLVTPTGVSVPLLFLGKDL